MKREEQASKLGVDWITWLRDVKEKPETTWKTYTRTLIAWIEWTTYHDVDPLQPALDELERFTLRPRKNGKRGAIRTRRREVASLRSWFGWMSNRGYIPMHPAIELTAPTAPEGRGNPIPDEHWQRLWEVTRTPEEIFVAGLGRFAGCRSTEVRSIRDDRLGPYLVTVTRKGGEDQVLPWRDLAIIFHTRRPDLLPDLSKYENAGRTLRRHRASNGGRVVPSEAEPYIRRQVLAPLCKRAGIPAYTPHRLRDAFAESLLDPPINMPSEDVSDLLGHTNLNQIKAYRTAAAGRLSIRYPELGVPQAS